MHRAAAEDDLAALAQEAALAAREADARDAEAGRLDDQRVDLSPAADGQVGPVPRRLQVYGRSGKSCSSSSLTNAGSTSANAQPAEPAPTTTKSHRGLRILAY